MYFQPESCPVLATPLDRSVSIPADDSTPPSCTDYTDIHWGQQYCQSGRQDQAQKKFETALAHFAQANDAIGIGKSLNGLSQVCLTQARYDRALAYSKAAVSVLEETAAELDYAIALYQLGISYFELQQTNRAEQTLEQALAKFHELADVEHENHVLIYLGQLYARQHQVWCALACYDAVLDSLSAHPFLDDADVILAMVLQAIRQID